MLDKFSFCTLAFFMAFPFFYSACGDSSSNSDSEELVKIEGQKETVEEGDEPQEEGNSLESSESSEDISSSSEGEEVTEPESSSSVFVPVDSSYYDAANNTLTDFRNGKVYRTVAITVTKEKESDEEESDEEGGEKEMVYTTLVWMTENLNISYDIGSAKSYCLEDDPEDCSKYGYRYTWSAAMDSAGKYSDATAGCGYEIVCKAKILVRGACPKGWHLPSKTDFNDLVEMAGGKNEAAKKLDATSGWKNEKDNGSDDYGFAAIPGGYWDNYRQEALVGSSAYFWSMVQYVPSTSTTTSYQAGIMNITGRYVYIEGYDKRYAFSVRCILDSQGNL